MSELEIWKDIEGYEGLYQISNLGRVKSLNNNKTKKEKIKKNRIYRSTGYYCVNLSKNSKGKNFLIHRLIAIHFIDNPDNHLCVNHINRDKKDNKIYIWPSSIHSLYLFTFGLNYDKLDGMLDNSINKIGNKMYGTELKISSFYEMINKNDEKTIILLNGGIFNKEIIDKTINSKIKFVSIE